MDPIHTVQCAIWNKKTDCINFVSKKELSRSKCKTNPSQLLSVPTACYDMATHHTSATLVVQLQATCTKTPPGEQHGSTRTQHRDSQDSIRTTRTVSAQSGQYWDNWDSMRTITTVLAQSDSSGTIRTVPAQSGQSRSGQSGQCQHNWGSIGTIRTV